MRPMKAVIKSGRSALTQSVASVRARFADKSKADKSQSPNVKRPAKRIRGMRHWRWGRIFGISVGLLVLGAITGGILFVWAIVHYGRDLPDYKQLAHYEPAVMTRIHAGDGSLLTEFATERRLFVPYNVIPEKVVRAVMAAEDKTFFEHGGLDYLGMVRAAVYNVLDRLQGSRRLQGASTITQQVAKNFLLTSDQRYERKIKEAILTIRIEEAFTKPQIMELYLNEVYLGYGSYGVAAAALNYFAKSMDELTVAESAYLAALLKAPTNYHPTRRREAAVGRRDWVLGRMLTLGYIDRATYDEAIAEPLAVRERAWPKVFRADYFVEEVRRELYDLYGQKRLYAGGLSVHTTLEPRLQAIAEKALRDGLVTYDRRHGWRGPIRRINAAPGVWRDALEGLELPLGMESWQAGVVLGVEEGGALIGLSGDQRFGFVPLEELTWARAWREGERLGSSVKAASEVLQVGDVVAVEAIEGEAADAKVTKAEGVKAEAAEGDAAPSTLATWLTETGETLGDLQRYSLRQIPAVEGGIVAMDPHTGRVLAMVGGFDYGASEYNRATQAERQPGSAFKPFVYAAALDRGFTPSSLILDAPFVIDQGQGQGKWKPRNSSNKFYGPSTLRLGLEKSRNLMTVRLAQSMGMEPIVQVANRFGIGENLQPTLAASLGSAEVSLLNLTSAYSMLVNGGQEIRPSLIDRIQDRRGATLYRHDGRPCSGCDVEVWDESLPEPEVPDTRARVIDERTAYQVVSMMEGVVKRGTGRRIASLGLPLAGKTGTTNESADTWFVGFAPDLAVGVFVGFDSPRSLGNGEEGSSVSAPIFRAFMAEALKGQPSVPFRIPPGVRLVRVNGETGLPAKAWEKNIILEAFIPGTEPTKLGTVLDGGQRLVQTDSAYEDATSGIY